MSHPNPHSSDLSWSVEFAAATGTANTPQDVPRKTPPPFSLRLSAEERATLEQMADGRALGGYIKARLFDRDVTLLPKRKTRPVKDHAALAQVLGLLGNSRIASNLNQLAKAANMGVLEMSPEQLEELQTACAYVLAIRMELMRALGYKSEVPGDDP